MLSFSRFIAGVLAVLLVPTLTFAAETKGPSPGTVGGRVRDCSNEIGSFAAGAHLSRATAPIFVLHVGERPDYTGCPFIDYPHELILEQTAPPPNYVCVLSEYSPLDLFWCPDLRGTIAAPPGSWSHPVDPLAPTGTDINGLRQYWEGATMSDAGANTGVLK